MLHRRNFALPRPDRAPNLVPDPGANVDPNGPTIARPLGPAHSAAISLAVANAYLSGVVRHDLVSSPRFCECILRPCRRGPIGFFKPMPPGNRPSDIENGP